MITSTENDRHSEDQLVANLVACFADPEGTEINFPLGLPTLVRAAVSSNNKAEFKAPREHLQIL
jgi:hypothetical protein